MSTSTARTFGITLRQAALTVGFAYLLNPVPFAEFSILPKLVIHGNIDQTVANISANHGLFLAAIFCYAINFTEDVIISWALYILLAPVNRGLSLLAALFRLMYTAVALAGMFNLVTIYRLLTTPEYLSEFGPAQLHAQVDLLFHTFRYYFAFSIGVIFSIHLLLIGYLVARSRYMPWWLGVILIVDGLGWIVTNLQPYLYPNANLGLVGITSLGELIFMLWLLIFGWKMREPAEA